MEAQNLVSKFFPSQIIQSCPKPKKAILAIPRPSCSFCRSRIWVQSRPAGCISQRVSSLHKRIQGESTSRIVADASSDNKQSGTFVRKKKLAVFVSGGGSNFRSIHEASLREEIHGNVVVLVTNKPDCGGARYAQDKGIPVLVFPKNKDESDGLSPSDLVASLRTFEVEFILLAGYLKLIPLELIKAYSRSILNIHPSLLPAFGGKGFYGKKVHEAVIGSGARYSGPTIHFVDEHYDTGRILAQRVVHVLANDTAEDLAARVLREEHNLYVEVVAALCEDRIVWRQDGVPLIRSKENPDEFG